MRNTLKYAAAYWLVTFSAHAQDGEILRDLELRAVSAKCSMDSGDTPCYFEYVTNLDSQNRFLNYLSRDKAKFEAVTILQDDGWVTVQSRFGDQPIRFESPIVDNDLTSTNLKSVHTLTIKGSRSCYLGSYETRFFSKKKLVAIDHPAACAAAKTAFVDFTRDQKNTVQGTAVQSIEYDLRQNTAEVILAYNYPFSNYHVIKYRLKLNKAERSNWYEAEVIHQEVLFNP